MHMLGKTTLGLSLLGLAAFAGTRFEAQTRLNTKVQRHDRQIAELLRKVKALESANRSESSSVNLPRPTMNLHDAAARGAVDQIRYGLNIGSKVDHKDAKEQTPLMKACEKGKLRAARYLLVNGADRRAKNKEGHTPLSLAKVSGNKDLLTLLDEYGVR